MSVATGQDHQPLMGYIRAAFAESYPDPSVPDWENLDEKGKERILTFFTSSYAWTVDDQLADWEMPLLADLVRKLAPNTGTP